MPKRKYIFSSQRGMPPPTRIDSTVPNPLIWFTSITLPGGSDGKITTSPASVESRPSVVSDAIFVYKLIEFKYYNYNGTRQGNIAWKYTTANELYWHVASGGRTLVINGIISETVHEFKFNWEVKRQALNGYSTSKTSVRKERKSFRRRRGKRETYRKLRVELGFIWDYADGWESHYRKFWS